ncbi:MAG TPA: hypothetical protein VJQ84_09950, partial [Solirubrobacterales bacterium]|nr:hypothetical protein [Solirubrobacterales bacterium]
KAAGGDVTCAVKAGSGAVSCLPTTISARAGITLGLDTRATNEGTSPRGFLLIGVAPDWVKTVGVRISGGPNRTLPVKHNVYSMRAAAPILAEEYCGRSPRGCVSLMKLGPSSR